ncbi:MAG: hypothetical protein OER21_02735 [Gemmatimonadota bacterium]|nr:hypothetical protein [Gemmatimonadota bacterium]
MLIAQAQVPAPPPIPDFLVQTGPDPFTIAIAVAIVVAAVGSTGLLWILVRGWVRRWTLPAGDAQAVQELRHAVHQLGAEVTELQERLDFAERVLATQKEAGRLPRAAGPAQDAHGSR